MVTYFALMLTPIFYGVVEPKFLTIVAILLFAPVFYLIIEIIDRVLPTPKAYDEEGMPDSSLSMPSDSSLNMPSLGGGAGGLGGEFGGGNFGGTGGGLPPMPKM